MADSAIIPLNIERFRQLLATHLDPDTRRIVERRLAEAEASLDAAVSDDRPSQP